MGAGFFSEVFTHVGQWGTHVDPPAHFIKGLRTVDQIDLKEMILPLAVIAGRGKNGEQRCKRHGPLSRLEPAGGEIFVRGSKNHTIRAREDGYRPRDRHNQGRLFARNLRSEHEPPPDRVADKPRSSARIRSAGGREFSKTKRWLWISGPRLCDSTIGKYGAGSRTWSKMCLVIS